MKKQVQFFMVALLAVGMLAGFTACEKDDNNDTSNGTTITGEWEFNTAVVKELEAENISEAEKVAISTFLARNMSESFEGMIFDFQSEGKLFLFWIDEPNDREEVSYTIEGNILSAEDADGYGTTGQYSITGNTLYWDADILAVPDEMAEELMGMGVTKSIVRLTFTKK